jgi:hypothetical protein
MADSTPVTETHAVWNYLRIQRVPAEGTVRLMVGPGGMTRQDAIDDVSVFLDDGVRNAATSTLREKFRAAGESWRLKTATHVQRGVEVSDEVFVGDFVWVLYLHFDTVDPLNAAIDWAQVFSGNGWIPPASGKSATVRPAGPPVPG